jgi:hypothetical protein
MFTEIVSPAFGYAGVIYGESRNAQAGLVQTESASIKKHAEAR